MGEATTEKSIEAASPPAATRSSAETAGSLKIKEDEEYYIAEKKCAECENQFTTSVLKNQVSNKGEAIEHLTKYDVCGTCRNKEKIAAAAEQMKNRG